MPSVFAPITGVRPGKSSGLMPIADSHTKVLAKPSKVIVPSVSSTKITPLTGSAGSDSNPAPGQRRPARPSGAAAPSCARNTAKGSALPSQSFAPNASTPAKLTAR